MLDSRDAGSQRSGDGAQPWPGCTERSPTAARSTARRFLSRGAGRRADRSNAACNGIGTSSCRWPSTWATTACRIGNVMPGFGHVGLGGSVGWTDPADGVAFALVHNRLLTPFVMTDHAAFVGIYALIRQAAAAGPRTRLPAGDRVRCAVLRAGSGRRLTRCPVRPVVERIWLCVRRGGRDRDTDLFPGASSCHNASVLTTDVAFEGLDGACPRGGRQARWPADRALLGSQKPPAGQRLMPRCKASSDRDRHGRRDGYGTLLTGDGRRCRRPESRPWDGGGTPRPRTSGLAVLR